MTEPNSSRELAAILLQINAIRLSPHQPFTWASGLQSPVYCDNRLILSYPAYRNKAIEGLQALAGQYGPIDAIAGVATAGIPHGMLLADRLSLPFLYVRSQPKGHGKGNQIEGVLQPGQRLLVIEDLISTGGSSLQAVQALRDAGAEVAAVLALFSYSMTEAEQRFSTASVPLATVSNYPAVVDVALQHGAISTDEHDLLKAWYRDPRAWSEAALLRQT